mgnify:CR=1 FL=1
MIYKDSDGTQYKISYSEELQLKNLQATREQTFWLKKNFYIMILLGAIVVMLLAMVFGVIYWLDYNQIFTRILNGR